MNTGKMKVCSKCKIEKEVDLFCNAVDGKEGKKAQCRHCDKVAVDEWRKNNPDKYLEQGRRQYQKNKKQILIRTKNHRDKNKEKVNEKVRNRRKIKKDRYVYHEDKERFKKNNKKSMEFAKENFTPMYINRVARKRGFTNEQIKEYPELIEALKILIKTKRLWKTSQN